jgi:lipid-binding SYLF domain-containing protein
MVHQAKTPFWLMARAMLWCWLLLLALPSWSDSRQTIDTQSEEALQRLAQHWPASAQMIEKASGVLIFPDVVKVGFGVGGQYGEGVLRIGGKPVSYFSTAGASFGLQLGAEYKAEVILFMTPQALADFRNGHGWTVGTDNEVQIVDSSDMVGADIALSEQRVIAFIFSNQGVMGNLTLAGSKITPIAR